MKRPLAISFPDLPPRARAASDQDLSRVFGGCLGRGQTCRALWDCCAPYSCQDTHAERRCF